MNKAIINSAYGMSLQNIINEPIKTYRLHGKRYIDTDSLEKQGFEYSHTALRRGYHTVKTETVKPYNGRFGVGVIIESNYPKSTQYHCVEYWIKRGDIK
jgi:hypothetical protein